MIGYSTDAPLPHAQYTSRCSPLRRPEIELCQGLTSTPALYPRLGQCAKCLATCSLRYYPQSNVETAMSSSISSQCIPIPLAMSRQGLRCFGVASLKRGNHSRGADISRPSDRATMSASALKRTLSARTAVGLVAFKVFIPLRQLRFC